MKFSLFIHLERISAEESQQKLYEEFLQLCEIADKGGMHAIWTGEHHGMNFTIAPNPFINLVDLARRTENVRLGTGTVVAPFWHPNSHDFAVASGCNVQVTPLWPGDEEVESLMDRFNTACENNPSVPRPKIMLLRHTYVGDGEEDIQQGAEEINRFYNYFGAWFKNERPINQGLIETLSDEDIANNPMYSPQSMRENNVIGDAETVIKRLKAYEALGYDEYSFWIDTGMSFERKKASLERFIKDVMPAFQ